MNFDYYYLISAILISSFFAKNMTIKNRGYDLERALRIRLVECVLQLVIFVAISFVFIGLIKKNIILATVIVIGELVVMYLYEEKSRVEKFFSKFSKRPNYDKIFITNDDVEISEKQKYYQYVVTFLSNVIFIFVPVFLIFADFIFIMIQQGYQDFPFVMNVMKDEQWIEIITGLSIINILLLNKKYVLINKDVKENFSASDDISNEDKVKLNEWRASIEANDKKI